ncbi:hypothetical protein CEXT_578601 [Caerostris extrusa]|uniref:Ycf15 n=1 Tax=Caerostris extrusa TaxID=172846 RepID=A0AAV4S7I6_CAEEX|nr:hypothetical protein CEXT_578601 [Caerostris extrusa]
MRYLNDQPMRCSSPWQRDPVNRSRGDDLPIIRIGMRKRKKKKSLTMWFSRRRSRDFWESRLSRVFIEHWIPPQSALTKGGIALDPCPLNVALTRN